MEDVTMLKASVTVEGEENLFYTWAVKYQGKAWLAPQWKETPNEGYVAPAWLIPLEQFPYQDLGRPTVFGQFAVNAQLPKVLFDGPISPEEIQQFAVVMEPAARAAKSQSIKLRVA